MTTAEILANLEGVRKTGDCKWQAKCPAHDDRNPSLSVSSGDDGTTLLHCHAGCAVGAVVSAIGITKADLFAGHNGDRAGRDAKAPNRSYATIERYAELRARGRAFTINRYPDKFATIRIEIPPDDKTYRSAHQNGRGWIGRAPDGLRPLFHRDDLADGDVYLPEGEKCTDIARELGLNACSWSGGTNAVHLTNWLPLAGRSVVILEDNDEPGRQCTSKLLAKLIAIGATVRVVKLPGLPHKGDIEQFVEQRDSRDDADIKTEIESLAAATEPSKAAPPEESGAKASTCPTPNVLMAGAISTKPIHWLWENRLERGAFNLLAGDPGCGKSLLATDFAATVTTGAGWPDARHDLGRPPQNVLIVASEDDPAKSIVPRLTAAGADLDRVAILRTVIEDDHERQLCLQRDLRAIEQAVEQVGSVALVIIDPLDSYLGKADSNVNEQVRQVLEPLVGLAERLDICVLGIKHLNKAIKTTPTALYRIGGSIAFVALPRTAHILGKDPDDKRRKLFAPVKVSHGRTPDALAYAVEVNDAGLPFITWETEAVEVDPDDVVAGTKGRTATAKDRAVEWLMTELEDGPVASKDITDKAKAIGVSSRTLDRAKATLGVVALQEREDDQVIGWTVALPTERGAP